MKQDDTLPIIAFATPRDREVWREAHYQDVPGIWLTIAKQGSAIPTVSYGDALERALCYGCTVSERLPRYHRGAPGAGGRGQKRDWQ